MAGDGGEEQIRPSDWKKKIEDQWLKTKEHAETYPYVWASYIVVYGFFGVYATYRWRKLRKTEDRVRMLLEKRRKRLQAEESATSSGSDGSPSSGKSQD